MTSLTLDQFHVRPPIQPDESWQAYLLRFASENGVNGIPELAKILGVKSIELLCSNPTIATGVPQIELPSCNVGKRIVCVTSRGRAWNARVCPLCFKSSPAFGRIQWDHPLQLRCPVHGCLLVDRCPSCHRMVKHDRKHINRCDCNKQFSLLSPTPAPAWVISMEIAFKEAFKDLHTTAIGNSLARDGARVLDFFASCKADHGVYQRHKVRDKTAMVMSTSFSLLEKCFHDSWTGMSKEFQELASVDDGENFHRMRAKLRLSKFRAVSEFASMIRGQVDRAKKNIDLLQPAQQGLYRRITQLKTLTGLSPYKLRSLAAQGHISGTHVQWSRAGKVQHLISSARFDEIAEECKRSTTLVIAANRLSVSVSTVKHLVDKRILSDKSTRPAYLQQLIGSNDLDDFDCFLNRHTIPKQSLLAEQRTYLGSTVDEVIKSHPQDGAIKLFDALKANDLSLYTAISQPSSLGDYYFDQRKISCWRVKNLPVELARRAVDDSKVTPSKPFLDTPPPRNLK